MGSQSPQLSSSFVFDLGEEDVQETSISLGGVTEKRKRCWPCALVDQTPVNQTLFFSGIWSGCCLAPHNVLLIWSLLWQETLGSVRMVDNSRTALAVQKTFELQSEHDMNAIWTQHDCPGIASSTLNITLQPNLWTGGIWSRRESETSISTCTCENLGMKMAGSPAALSAKSYW